MNQFSSNIPNLIMMIRPGSFGFNPQTAHSNSFQNKIEIDQVASKAIKEFDEMTSIIQTHNIALKVFEDNQTGSPDAVFPNNWISNIPGNSIVVYPMLTENRKKEVRPDIINWLSNRLDLSQIIDLRASEHILEGTGSIVFDHDNKTAFACISPRTSIKLLNQLCETIRYQSVSFESVDLQGEQIYHTNVMMSIASDFALVCFESIPDILERQMLKKQLEKAGKEVIDISYSQMNSFAANALEVISVEGEKFFLMSQTAHNCLSTNQKNRIETYAKILAFAIPTIEKVGGGSVRCMLAGFFD